MSIIHFDATTASSAVEVVELQNAFCFDIGITFASAELKTNSAGNVTCNSGGSLNTLFNWIDPLPGPGSPVFEVKRDASNNDEPTGPAAGVWTPVTSNPAWKLLCFTTTFGPIIRLDATFTVSIRQGTGPVIDTASWTLSIECATLN